MKKTQTSFYIPLLHVLPFFPISFATENKHKWTQHCYFPASDSLQSAVLSSSSYILIQRVMPTCEISESHHALTPDSPPAPSRTAWTSIMPETMESPETGF